MSDLAEYHSQADTIAELEAQVASLQADLVRSRKLVSKHKRTSEKLREKFTGKKPPSRCGKARELIARREAGTLDITLTEIAKQCFLGYSTVKALARDYRKQLEPSGKTQRNNPRH